MTIFSSYTEENCISSDVKANFEEALHVCLLSPCGDATWISH